MSEDPSLAAQMGEFKPILSSFSVFKLQRNYLSISVNIFAGILTSIMCFVKLKQSFFAHEKFKLFNANQSAMVSGQ